MTTDTWTKVSKAVISTLDGQARLGRRFWLMIVPGFFVIGLALTWGGHSTWDTPYHVAYMKWLLGRFQGLDRTVDFEMIKWYGPLWEYPMGILCAILGGLNDPTWIRHATTFCLLPVTLVLVCRVIVRAGYGLSTGVLAAAMLFGMIRFGGHSVLNIKDFPFACGYLLATLYMWKILALDIKSPERFGESSTRLFALTFVAVIPYLMRAPVIHHFLALVLIGMFTAIFESNSLPTKTRLKAAFLPLIYGIAIIWCLWPTLWEYGLKGWAQSFGVFSKFTWTGRVRIFGEQLQAERLPWWYAPAWLVVIFEPVSFVCLVAGLVVFLFRDVVKGILSYGITSTRVLYKSLPVWLSIFALAPWLGFFILHPVFYDEERHLLFAFPPLAVAAAIGLSRLPKRVRYGLAAAITVSALWAYGEWGKLSYVYKNPLVGDRRSSQFMGDYWGVSVGAGAKALYDYVPSGSSVVFMAPEAALLFEIRRLAQNPLRRHGEAKTFELIPEAPKTGEYYVLAINRNGLNDPILADIATGKSQLIWSEALSFDKPHIVLAKYFVPCDYCKIGSM